MQVHAGAHKGQEKVLGPLEMELQTVNLLMYVLALNSGPLQEQEAPLTAEPSF